MEFELQLPGFRFHPTEEELLQFYLKNTLSGNTTHPDIIGYLNIYRYDPWLLPGLAKIGEREWYFFVPRDRKHGNGGRPNRTTENGFWKATGSDRKIYSLSDTKKHLGLKKTLVFYKGRAPRGNKTDWVMNEYRLPDSCSLPKEIVLCKIYRKATSMKVLEQRASAIEEKINTFKVLTPLSPEETNSYYTQSDDLVPPPATMVGSCHDMASSNNEFQHDLLFFVDEKLKQEFPPPPVTSLESCHMVSKDPDELRHDVVHKLDEELKEEPDVISDATSEISNRNNKSSTKKSVNLRVPVEDEKLLDLQLPKMNTDWTQDSFWTELCSPWLENMMFTSPYANILNF